MADRALAGQSAPPFSLFPFVGPGIGENEDPRKITCVEIRHGLEVLDAHDVQHHFGYPHPTLDDEPKLVHWTKLRRRLLRNDLRDPVSWPRNKSRRKICMPFGIPVHAEMDR